MAGEVMPGDPAHEYNIRRDPAFSDVHLDDAAVETVGKMDHQGIAPTDHNSGDITRIGPIDRPDDHNGPRPVFHGGFDRVS